MFTISALVKLALSLGLTISFQHVAPKDAVSAYFNEETNTTVNCIQVETDLGQAAVCPMGGDYATVYIVKK